MSKLHVAETVRHLLFIDEDISTLRSIPSIPSFQAWTLHLAQEFTTARTLLQEHPIELLILNIEMSRSDQESGFAFALWLRESSPYEPHIVFTSKAYPARLYKETALCRYSALEYIDKPVSPKQWKQLLEAYVEGQLQPPLPPSNIPRHAGVQASTHYKWDPEQFLIDPEEWAESVFRSDTHDAIESLNSPHAARAQVQMKATHRTRPDTHEQALSVRNTLEGQPSKGTSAAQMTSTQPLQTATQQSLRTEATSSSLSPSWKDEKTQPNRPPSERTSTRPLKNPVSLSQPPASQHSEELFKQGMEALQHNHIQEALESFRTAFQLQAKPQHKALYAWTLGISAPHDSKRQQASETLLIQVTQEAPAYEQGHLLLGRFYQYNRRPRDAFEVYRIGLSYNPQFQEIYREYRLLQLQMTR